MLSTADIAKFDEQGYLVLSSVLSTSLIDAVLRQCWEVTRALSEKAVAYGWAPSDLLELDGPAQLVELTAQTGRYFGQYYDISLPPGAALSKDTPLNLCPAIFAALTDEALLDQVEALVGPEVCCNPTQHLRLKLPARALPEGADGLAARVPWHQDLGVLLEEADTSHILTVWAPLTRATVENGCLMVVPGSHREQLLGHCPTPSGWTIPDHLLATYPRPVALEMGPGSVLFMHQRTVHSSLENTTASELRVSLDLRYQPAGERSGRPLFPSFLARSRHSPNRALSDWQSWAALWSATRERLAGDAKSSDFFRWGTGGPLCA